MNRRSYSWFNKEDKAKLMVLFNHTQITISTKLELVRPKLRTIWARVKEFLQIIRLLIILHALEQWWMVLNTKLHVTRSSLGLGAIQTILTHQNMNRSRLRQSKPKKKAIATAQIMVPTIPRTVPSRIWPKGLTK